MGSQGGRGKYDMWYDWVVKALVSSCMSVGRPLAERLDLPCLAMGHFPSQRENAPFSADYFFDFCFFAQQTKVT